MSLRWSVVCCGVMLWLIVPQSADATCWREIRGAYVYECCQAPEGKRRCRRLYRRKIRRRRRGRRWRKRRLRRRSRTDWISRGIKRFSWELSLGGGLQLSPMPDEQQQGVAVGGLVELQAGFRYRIYFNHSSPADRMGWAAVFAGLATMGLIFVPKSAWLGNDLGLDVTARWMSAGLEKDSTMSIALGLSPSLRVTRGRWRFPSIVGFLLPEVGLLLSVPQVSPAFYLRFFRFPVSVLLHERFGLTFSPSFWLFLPFSPERSRWMFSLHLSLVFR